jgi:hypothetical protein
VVRVRPAARAAWRIGGVVGPGRTRSRLLQRASQRIDLLGERADPHVVVVQLLPDHAHVVREVVDHQFLIGERLARRLGLLIEAGVDRLQRLGDRSDQVLQQL